MEREGTIRILTLSRTTDPRPWTYTVTFAAKPGGALTPHDCLGITNLDRYLAELGILPAFRKAALDEVRAEGKARLPRVRLTEVRMKELGLL
jgi:hypothetical protein